MKKILLTHILLIPFLVISINYNFLGNYEPKEVLNFQGENDNINIISENNRILESNDIFKKLTIKRNFERLKDGTLVYKINYKNIQLKQF